MEQHPVPQNIGSFEFKLIGDITLKQFAYLASGLLLAYLSTKLSLIPSLFRFPLAAVFALLGFGLAFVPIEERPLDRWLRAFFKSIYAPTHYVWRKQNLPPHVLLTLPASAPPIQEITAPTAVSARPQQLAPEYTSLSQKSVAPNKPEAIQIPPTSPPTETIQLQTAPMPTMAPPPRVPSSIPPEKTTEWWLRGAPPSPRPSAPSTKPVPPSVTGKRIVFAEKEDAGEVSKTVKSVEVEKVKFAQDQTNQKLNQQIQILQQELAQGSIAKERLFELQQLLTQLLTEKDKLSQELTRVRQQLNAQKEVATIKPTEYTKAPEEVRTTVKMVPPSVAPKVGIPTLTTQPNVITGIIKDSQGNLLPNLIVTVKDKDGIPVRALKTNKLGQFAASTPLPNGTFFIEVEDPKTTFQFQRIEAQLTGQVLPPLEISAISQKDVTRQKLMTELFGKNRI